MKQLDTADFIIELEDCKIGIEKKSVQSGDLTDSIYNERLMNQVSRMVDEFDHSYLWIDGQFVISQYKVFGFGPVVTGTHQQYRLTQDMHPNLLWSRLADIQRLGCTVVHGLSFDNMVKLVVSKSKSKVKIPRVKGVRNSDPKMEVLLSVRNIGPQRASKLLQEYGSLWECIRHLEESGKIQ